MPRQLRVFLCHASQDKPVVRELYHALKAEGWVDPWLDKAKLLPGQDWEMVIENAVDDSDVVIICLSGQSVSKEGYVQREIRYAYDLALEKPEGTIFLIPLRLDDCAMPRKLRSFHWVDYFGEEKEKSYFDLLEALKLRYEQKIGDEETPAQADLKRGIPEVRFTQKKPYTKILNPATLNPAPIQKTRTRPNYRQLGFAGIALLLLTLVGLGLNSLFNKSPEVPLTPSLQVFTETPKLSTETSVPFVSTPTETSVPDPTATTVLGIGSTSRSLKDDMVLVYVPAGEFLMGSDDGNQDEQPVHQVYLDAYWIDQTEVTNAMYAKCVEANKCNPPKNKRSATNPSYYADPKFDDYPVIHVTWEDAESYCAWVGRSLPTEAQWEKAARGLDGGVYPWGNVLPKDSLLNYNQLYKDTTRVGSFPEGASIYGANDMAGNVWEWVRDWYDVVYYQSNLSTPNPSGPDAGKMKVQRGGSWEDAAFSVRSSNRAPASLTDYGPKVGFRCALTP